MGMDALRKALDARGGRWPDCQREIKRWEQATAGLLGQIEALVQPLRDEERLFVDHTIVDVTEQELGEYHVNGLDLRFTDVVGKIEVLPRSPLVVGVRVPDGSWVTGIRGRVDMIYGALRVPLVRKEGDDTWYVGLEGELRPLTERSLEQAISYLLGLD